MWILRLDCSCKICLISVQPRADSWQRQGPWKAKNRVPTFWEQDKAWVLGSMLRVWEGGKGITGESKASGLFGAVEKRVGRRWYAQREAQTSHNHVPAQIQTEGQLGTGPSQSHPNPPSFALSLSFIASIQVNKLTQLFLYEFSQLHLGKNSSREWVGS